MNLIETKVVSPFLVLGWTTVILSLTFLGFSPFQSANWPTSEKNEQQMLMMIIIIIIIIINESNNNNNNNDNTTSIINVINTIKVGWTGALSNTFSKYLGVLNFTRPFYSKALKPGSPTEGTVCFEHHQYHFCLLFHPQVLGPSIFTPAFLCWGNNILTM